MEIHTIRTDECSKTTKKEAHQNRIKEDCTNNTNESKSTNSSTNNNTLEMHLENVNIIKPRDQLRGKKVKKVMVHRD